MQKYCLPLGLLFLALPVSAELLIDTPLSFGEISIRGNDSVSTVSITRNGIQKSTNQIYVLKAGSPGVFTISGLPAYTTVHLSVDLPAASVMMYPGTAQFEMTAVDMPSSVNLGPTGSTQFKIGGTLQTSGNPAENYYSGATYTIYLNLNLDY